MALHKTIRSLRHKNADWRVRGNKYNYTAQNEKNYKNHGGNNCDAFAWSIAQTNTASEAETRNARR